ncbi:MAG: class I SAM-dependent methyltransferase [Chitinophagaceae bacterium]|nr:MAG: class I SAM-dependent methyltransferase [Chitinophagaceae bacterium]
MTPRLLSLLRCPLTGDELRLQVISTGTGTAAAGVKDGILFSPSSFFFPVINGIPRMNLDAFRVYEKFLKQHVSDYLARAGRLQETYRDLLADSSKKNRKTIRSFESEWKGFDEKVDRTWDEDADGMLRRFYRETGETAASLHNKLVFDAGCGNGILDLLLAREGIEIVAMDFTRSVERPAQQAENTKAMFVQGDVAWPPFARQGFDIVHCSGVLVHMADPGKIFSTLAGYPRPGGKLSIWVYHPQRDPLHRLMVASRKPVSRLSLPLQKLLISTVLLPLSWIIKKLKGNRQSIREMKTDLADHYTPEYRREFTHDTIRNWFASHNYEDIRHTTVERFGFNTTGIRVTGQDVPINASNG